MYPQVEGFAMEARPGPQSERLGSARLSVVPARPAPIDPVGEDAGAQGVRRPYVVVLTAGREDGGKRATIAISAACTAQSLDLDTHVFLVGDGSYWAYEGSADDVHVRGFPALQDLIEAFVELGGRMYVCSACDSVCALPEGTGEGPRTRRSGVEPRGLAAVLPYTLGGGCVTF